MLERDMPAGVYFDWGGVLAEEGFQEGLWAIARQGGLDPEAFFQAAVKAILDTGYVKGRSDEAEFWRVLRRATGVKGTDEALRAEILTRFRPRPLMFQAVERLRRAGLRLGILSDQTNWLDELDARHKVFGRFDVVLNSYHTGLTKSEPEFFDLALARLGLEPGQTLFIDDNAGNIAVAQGRGLRTILYTTAGAFQEAFAKFFPSS